MSVIDNDANVLDPANANDAQIITWAQTCFSLPSSGNGSLAQLYGLTAIAASRAFVLFGYGIVLAVGDIDAAIQTGQA